MPVELVRSLGLDQRVRGGTIGRFGVGMKLSMGTGSGKALTFVPKPYAPRRMRAAVTAEARYRTLTRRAVEWEQTGLDKRRRQTHGDSRVRSGAAREAVVIRSRGRCENPECLLPDLPYRTKAGEPLLEVDHVDEHASGGRDHPVAMVALCPNCHRNKTHGADGPELTERLREVALELHARWDGAPRA